MMQIHHQFPSRAPVKAAASLEELKIELEMLLDLQGYT
jgi:hypothetical protein